MQERNEDCHDQAKPVVVEEVIPKLVPEQMEEPTGATGAGALIAELIAPHALPKRVDPAQEIGGLDVQILGRLRWILPRNAPNPRMLALRPRALASHPVCQQSALRWHRNNHHRKLPTRMESQRV